MHVVTTLLVALLIHVASDRSLAWRAVPTEQPASGATLDESVAAGHNFDKAEFRLWLPSGSGAVQAIVVLVPGSNGDGRPMADDPVWQAFAMRHTLALVGCRFTDKPHEQSFIEDYVDVSQGSGQALVTEKPFEP